MWTNLGLGFILFSAALLGVPGLRRLAGRDDLEVISVPTERRKETAARAEFLNAADVAMFLSTGDTVTFYPNGTLGTAPATLCLTGASGLNPKKIRLNITGRVSVEDAASCP